MYNDDRDWDDEYDPEELDVRTTPPVDNSPRWFSCLMCRSGLIVALTPNMITGTVCSCGQAFLFEDAGEDHIWRGPTHEGPTTSPD